MIDEIIVELHINIDKFLGKTAYGLL